MNAMEMLLQTRAQLVLAAVCVVLTEVITGMAIVEVVIMEAI